MLPIKFPVSWPFIQDRKFKMDFQYGCFGYHPGFPIGTILVLFYLQVTPILPIKFWVSWHYHSGEVQNRSQVQVGHYGGQPRFPIGTILLFFLFTCHCDTSYQVSTGSWVQEKKRKIVFQDGSPGFHLVLQIGTILVNFDLQVTPIRLIKFQVNWPFG